MKNLFKLLLVFTVLIIACEQKNAPGNNEPCDETFTYTALTADKTLITAEQTATITAEASGCSLSYSWTTTMGSIRKQGNTGIFVPSSCTAGEIQISCTVSDQNGESASKTITITVE